MDGTVFSTQYTLLLVFWISLDITTDEREG